MKSFKSCVLLLVSMFMLATFSINAAEATKQVDEDIPMEGEFGDKDMRSVAPIHAFLRDNVVFVEFYAELPSVTIVVRDADNNIVYSESCSSPQNRSISLAGLESGCYKLELVTPTGYTFGSFMYVY